MSNNTYKLVLLLVGLLLTWILTYRGCNGKTGKIAENSEISHIESHNASSDKGITSNFNKDSLNLAVKKAVENIKTGRETNNTALMMQEGIFVLRNALTLDPKNEIANFELGKMNLERGISSGDQEQIQKALEKSEVLLLLQPSNQEYLEFAEKAKQALAK